MSGNEKINIHQIEKGDKRVAFSFNKGYLDFEI